MYTVGHPWPHLPSLSVLGFTAPTQCPNLTFMQLTSTSPSNPSTWQPFPASLGQKHYKGQSHIWHNFNQPCCKLSLCTVLSICTTCSQSYPCNTCAVNPTKQLIHLSMPINTPNIAKPSSKLASSKCLYDVLKFGLLLDHIIPLFA